ncbi:MAG TPA: efflux RND transporter periplasmic adaptor subunit, partial [Verrucomicrobiae bacterium]|nr:efflux RND transporter periplasmic adaptor subunit [Verrucomicrobiae bacterium]
QVLFRIAADNRLEVAAQVAEADALALAEGQTAEFTLVDGSTVEGTLRRGPASIDSRTRTGEALFSLPAGTRVRAGMYLRGVAHLPERSVPAIPQSSVLYENGQAYVYVVGADNLVRRTDVQLGARDGTFIEIVSGLDLGTRVVGAGAAFLQDGTEVRAIASQAPAPSATAPVPPEQQQNLRGREG